MYEAVQMCILQLSIGVCVFLLALQVEFYQECSGRVMCPEVGCWGVAYVMESHHQGNESSKSGRRKFRFRYFLFPGEFFGSSV